MATTDDATTDDLDELYLARLNNLERQIRRQRRVLADHGNRHRDANSWDTIQRRHNVKAASFADHRHVIQELIEDLRFDVDVLVQDFRRFFAANDTDNPVPRRRRAR